MYVCMYVRAPTESYCSPWGVILYIRMYMLDFGLWQGSPREYEVICEGGLKNCLVNGWYVRICQ